MAERDEYWPLTKIPILGRVLKRIIKDREAIEQALDTGEETEGETKKKSYLLGLVKTQSRRFYNLLTSKEEGNNGKEKRHGKKGA